LLGHLNESNNVAVFNIMTAAEAPRGLGIAIVPLIIATLLATPHPSTLGSRRKHRFSNAHFLRTER
jgi:hypothetical protein|tara:strand:- start:682 stop:879 length:198 start_codon:yes stop_codon:yes gene_type:complete